MLFWNNEVDVVFFFFCSIKWSKDGQEYLTLPGKSSTTEIRELERVTSKLRIGNAASEDAGRYACQATNAFGTSHFTIDVTIWGKGFTSKTFAYLGLRTQSVIFYVYDFFSQNPLQLHKTWASWTSKVEVSKLHGLWKMLLLELIVWWCNGRNSQVNIARSLSSRMRNISSSQKYWLLQKWPNWFCYRPC